MLKMVKYAVILSFGLIYCHSRAADDDYIIQGQCRNRGKANTAILPTESKARIRGNQVAGIVVIRKETGQKCKLSGGGTISAEHLRLTVKRVDCQGEEPYSPWAALATIDFTRIGPFDFSNSTLGYCNDSALILRLKKPELIIPQQLPADTPARVSETTTQPITSN